MKLGKVIITQEEIDLKVIQFASFLDEKYPDENLFILMIMNGGAYVGIDLVREMKTFPVVDSLQSWSYKGMEQIPITTSTFAPEVVKGKNVLIVDDICDTGATLKAVTRLLLEGEPLSVKSFTLLTRVDSTIVKFTPNYTLFNVEKDRFFVGYGLDYYGKYRNLPEIRCMEK